MVPGKLVKTENFKDFLTFRSSKSQHIKNSYFFTITPTFLAPLLPDSYFFLKFLLSYFFFSNLAGHPVLNMYYSLKLPARAYTAAKQPV